MAEPERAERVELRERLLEPASGEIDRLYRVRRRRAGGRAARLAFAIARQGALVSLRVRYGVALVGEWSSRGWRAALNGWSGELRGALRQARRRPVAWASAVLVLALAIGSVTAVYAVVHAVLIAPLPFPSPDRLARVLELERGRPSALSVANWLDFQMGVRSLESIGVWFPEDTVIDEGEPQRLRAVRASAGLFAALGVEPQLGRAFAPGEDRAGGDATVILGHDLWQSRFGGDPGVLGRRLGVDGGSRTVIGVMPRGFAFPDASAAWLPLALDSDDLEPGQRGAHYLRAVGRLAPEASVETAAEELSRVARQLRAEHPRTNEGYDATAIPLHRFDVREVRAGLLWLWAAVGCVLLLACADVAALQLAAGVARREELAVRAALGARPLRLARQLASEALVLAAVGGTLGILLARGALALLPAFLPSALPQMEEIGLRLPVLCVALASALLAAVGFGVAPAVQAFRSAAVDALGARSVSGGQLRPHALLVGLQAACASLLLVGAGLSLRSLHSLAVVDPGFQAEEVVTYTVALPSARYPTPSDVARVTDRLVARARRLPGVSTATSASLPPLARRRFHGTFGIEGREHTPGEVEPHASIRAVSPRYFETLGIPVYEGRDFGASDAWGAPGVAILNRTAARQWWPGESPLGRRVRVHVGIAGPESFREVVGVVGDVRLGALGEAPAPAIYLPQSQYPWDVPVVLARPAPGHHLSAASLAATAREVDPQLATWDAAPLTAAVDAGLAEPRFRSGLLAGFAAAALLLAGIGLYGMLALTVAQRRRELGVRVALGARSAHVRTLIARGGLVPVAVGAALGLVASAALAPAVESALYGVAARDPATFLLAPALLLASAVAACVAPAWAAGRVDPATALRLD